MSARLFAASVAVTALVVVAVWVTDLSFQRAVLLAPVLVIGLGALAGLVLFWGRIGWDSLRRSRHPRLWVAGGIAFIALLVVLSLLGVNLPHDSRENRTTKRGLAPWSCDPMGGTFMDMDFTLTELDHRSADGIEISLLWSRLTNQLMVAVADSRSGESFEVPAPAKKALDVFRHPFAYAA